MIWFYNRPKIGVDLVDQSCQKMLLVGPREDGQQGHFLIFWIYVQLMHFAFWNSRQVHLNTRGGVCWMLFPGKWLNLWYNADALFLKFQFKLGGGTDCYLVLWKRGKWVFRGHQVEEHGFYTYVRQRDTTKWHLKCKRWLLGEHLRDIRVTFLQSVYWSWKYIFAYSI